MFDDIAAATVQIRCGTSTGSGFHFSEPGMVVTCFHVVEDDTNAVEAFTEGGDRWDLQFVTGSEPDQLDFAVYTVKGGAPNAPVLIPASGEAGRGQDVAFAGFPHGVPDLLVQRATVAGDESDESFYLDGSVNGGNSGGPVVDTKSGEVVGIVTGSRFPFAADLDAMAEVAAQLHAYCASISGGSMLLMGIDFGQFAAHVAQTNLLLSQLLEANANSGIGIALRITEVVEDMKIA